MCAWRAPVIEARRLLRGADGDSLHEYVVAVGAVIERAGRAITQAPADTRGRPPVRFGSVTVEATERQTGLREAWTIHVHGGRVPHACLALRFHPDPAWAPKLPPALRRAAYPDTLPCELIEAAGSHRVVMKTEHDKSRFIGRGASIYAITKLVSLGLLSISTPAQAEGRGALALPLVATLDGAMPASLVAESCFEHPSIACLEWKPRARFLDACDAWFGSFESEALSEAMRGLGITRKGWLAASP